MALIGWWRIARKAAPDRVVSTVDPQARHTRKSKSARRDGFRGHVSAEPDTGPITDAESTKAAGDEGRDAVVGQKMIDRDRYHQRGAGESVRADTPADEQPGDADAGQPDPTEQAERAGTEENHSSSVNAVDAVDADGGGQDATGQRSGLEMYGDSACGTGAARAAYAAAGHDMVIKPKPLLPAVAGGFTLDDFTVDERAATVTCPGGHTRTMTAKPTVTFGALCANCPLQARCTTAKNGRSTSIHEHEQLLREARARARTPEFKQAYPTRSSVERIISWTATNRGRRIKLRYIGVEKNHSWLRNRCAAINLHTLVNKGPTRANGARALA